MTSEGSGQDYVAKASPDGTLAGYDHNTGRLRGSTQPRIAVATGEEQQVGVTSSSYDVANKPEVPRAIQDLDRLRAAAEEAANHGDDELAERLRWRGERALKLAAEAAAGYGSLPMSDAEVRRVSTPAPTAPAPAAPSLPDPSLRTLAPLGLDFLQLAEPARPLKQVLLTFNGMGTWAIRYHEVVVTEQIVVLVYDSRYNHGSQFVPAASKHPVHVKIAETGQEFSCVSLDISWTMGCLDFVVLIIS